MGKKRKRRTKKQVVVKLWIVLLILIALVIGTIYGTVKLMNHNDNNNNNGVSSNLLSISMEKLQETKASNTQEEKTTSVSLVMVGDNLIHSSVYKDAQL